MSNQITEGFVNDYKANIELLLQQKGSRLEAAVTTDSYTGEGGRPVEQIGAVNARRVTGRHEDTPIIETPHESRWVEPYDYDWGDLIDNEDKLRRLVDPQSAYVLNGKAAMSRAKDDEIIAAMFSDLTKTGKGDLRGCERGPPHRRWRYGSHGRQAPRREEGADGGRGRHRQ